MILSRRYVIPCDRIPASWPPRYRFDQDARSSEMPIRGDSDSRGGVGGLLKHPTEVPLTQFLGYSTVATGRSRYSSSRLSAGSDFNRRTRSEGVTRG